MSEVIDAASAYVEQHGDDVGDAMLELTIAAMDENNMQLVANIMAVVDEIENRAGKPVDLNIRRSLKRPN